MENPILTTPHLAKLRKGVGGNSLHRRSLIKNSNVANVNEELNDDDAERSSLVASERAITSSTPLMGSPLRGRDTFSGSPQKEHYQGCLKLYAENKITKDNAWNLQLIDFMSSMLRRHDTRMENMQTASTVVDASARIYSFRVDGIHHDVLKMAGGLTKATQAKRGKKADDQFDEDGAVDGETQTQVKRKKKKAKGAIASNLETLNGEFESHDFIDPFFERLAATPGDVTSSNRAFNVTLPINDNTLALILRTDEIFLEPIKENESEIIDLCDKVKISMKLLPAFLDTDVICEPFSTFSISNWDPETEDTDANRIPNWVEENRLNLSQQALAFDVNAEVEPIPVEDQEHDLLEDEPLAGMSSDEEADVAVAACVARVPAAPAALCRRTDMRPSAPADSRLEYSYCGAIVTAWAGPSHWRLKNNRASKLSHGERTHTTAAAGAKQARTKRQLDFLGAGLAFDHNAPSNAEFEPTVSSKITISRKTLATGNTWRESNFRTPIDRGLDETHFRKLYLRQSVIMLKKKEIENSAKEDNDDNKKDSVHVTEALAHAYDLNNENDMSYCAASQNNDDWCNEEIAQGEEGQFDTIGLGDMVEPPTKIQKIFIPYAMRAKKVDMKHLKRIAWSLLTEAGTENPETENEEPGMPTTFFTLFFKLKEKLSPNIRETVSVAIVLLAVLHLANEKGLKLQSQSDLRDFKILGCATSLEGKDV